MSAELEFRGLRYRTAPGDGNSWFYLPGQPDVRRNASGTPQITVTDLGDEGYLVFVATWGGDAGDLEALREQIAGSLGKAPAQVVLAFAPISSPRCEALVGDGLGEYRTAATSATSGVPPYDAVFAVTLRAEQLASARAGLEGRSAFLALQYEAALLSTVTGSAILTASLRPLRSFLASRGGEHDALALLNEAVTRGLAEVTIDAPGPSTGLLTTTLYDRVLAEAARTLPNWLDRDAPEDLRVSVTLTQQVEEPVRAFSDIGSIVAGASTSAAPGGGHASD
jgi:hypothetical protein